MSKEIACMHKIKHITQKHIKVIESH